MLKAGDKFIDKIEKIEIKINDGNLSNKLNINDLCQIIKLHDGSNESSHGYFVLIKKLKLIKIKNFVYNLNNCDDGQQCDGDFMKLDELNILNNESLFLRNLDYYKQNRFNYSLLDKIDLLLINSNEIYFVLNDSNFYMQISLIDRLLAFYNEISINNSAKINSNSNDSKFYDKFKLLTVKLTNFYFNLIHDKTVFTLGSSLLNFDLNRNEKVTSNTVDFSLYSEYFVVFKSNLENKR
jgi:hypothetical protein